MVSVQKTGIVYEIQVYERLLKDLNLLDILIYGSIYLSLGAAATMYASCLLLGLPPSPELMFIAFSSTFAIYNFNRLTDKKEDVINHPERYKFNMSYGHIFMVAAVLLYGASIFLAAEKSLISVTVVLFPLFMGALYSIKLPSFHSRKSKKKQFTRLKDIPLVKNLTATTAWTVSMTFLPVFYLTGDIGKTFIFVFLFIYGRDLINTISFDIRDIEGDRSHKVLTLPVIYGLNKCKRFLSILNLILFGVIVSITYFGALPISAYIVIVLSTMYTDFYLSLIPDALNQVFLYEIIIDGEFIAFGLFTLLGKLIT